MSRPKWFSEEAQAGWVLLELLLCCVLLGVLAVATMPAARELYLKAAVEYETECLFSDIRQLQALSRTVNYNDTGPGRSLEMESKPSLALDGRRYHWRRQQQIVRTHDCLPGIEVAVRGQISASGTVIAFTDWGRPYNRLMTIDVFTETITM